MNLSRIQELTAELVVNRNALSQFIQDPELVFSMYGLEQEECEYLRGLRLSDIETFRGVIEGTREVHFTQVFREVAAHLGPKAWPELIRRFHQSTVIRSNEKGADLIQFARFCDDGSEVSFWVWHCVLKALTSSSLSQLPTEKFQRIGRNSILTKYLTDVSASEITKGSDDHYFLYILDEHFSDNMVLLEIDSESASNLRRWPDIDDEIRETLRECGVLL